MPNVFDELLIKLHVVLKNYIALYSNVFRDIFLLNLQCNAQMKITIEIIFMFL